MLEVEGTEQETEVKESSNPESQEQQGSSEAPEANPLVDLDSIEKFRFGGKEWTPKEFQGAYMMQSDYTRKTQALAEERKFYDNLDADLAKVKQNPALSGEFKKVYPEKFHKFLGYVTPAQAAQAAKQEQQAAGVDPAFMERFNKLEQALHDKEVAAVDAELDAKFSQLTKKYPLADEEMVLARASAILDRGEKLTDQVWDKLWKTVHDRNQKLADQYYSQKVNQQKNANSKGKDVASGGGIPGQAPKMPRTIKEATSFALQELEQA